MDTIRALKRHHPRQLATNQVGRYVVSTVCLDIGVTFDYETMVFPCFEDGTIYSARDIYEDRYASEIDALKGHLEIVERVAKELK